ncbi:hypothetical protein V8C43DRAFT_263431 [Trichoderma afarasin]
MQPSPPPSSRLAPSHQLTQRNHPSRNTFPKNPIATINHQNSITCLYPLPHVKASPSHTTPNHQNHPPPSTFLINTPLSSSGTSSLQAIPLVSTLINPHSIHQISKLLKLDLEITHISLQATSCSWARDPDSLSEPSEPIASKPENPTPLYINTVLQRIAALYILTTIFFCRWAPFRRIVPSKIPNRSRHMALARHWTFDPRARPASRHLNPFPLPAPVKEKAKGLRRVKC